MTSETDSCPNLDDVAWYTENSGGVTHPVGQNRPCKWLVPREPGRQLDRQREALPFSVPGRLVTGQSRQFPRLPPRSRPSSMISHRTGTSCLFLKKIKYFVVSPSVSYSENGEIISVSHCSNVLFEAQLNPIKYRQKKRAVNNSPLADSKRFFTSDAGNSA